MSERNRLVAVGKAIDPRAGAVGSEGAWRNLLWTDRASPDTENSDLTCPGWKKRSAVCHDCETEGDSVEHTLFQCER